MCISQFLIDNKDLLEIIISLLQLGSLIVVGIQVYDKINRSPLVKGEIMYAMTANYMHNKKNITIIMLYAFITNQRDYKIQFLEYSLKVKNNNIYVKTERLYNTHSVDTWTLSGINNQTLEANLSGKFLHQDNKPLSYGEHVKGFIIFGIDDYPSSKYHNITEYKFTVTDVFGNNHDIKAKSSDISKVNLYLIGELSGVDLAKISK
jgi:hypothetical protein